MPLLRSLLALLLVVSTAVADDLRTLDNKTITGTVVAVDDKEVSLKNADGEIVKTRLDEVIALDLRTVKGVPEKTSFTDIRLLDDTVLLCSKYAIKGPSVEATFLSGQAVTFPLASVATLLRGAEDPVLKKKWDDIVANKVKRDQIVPLYKGGVLNSLPGTFGDADAKGEKIKFRTTDGDSLDVPIANMQGLIFYRPEATASVSPICIVYDTMGNALAATKIHSDGKKVTIVTTIPKVEIACDLSSIARFDFNMGKLTFLSDLTPTKVVQTSAVGLVLAYRKDVNLDGDPIVLDRAYAKGLSLHAHTELEYDLKGKFKKFSAVLGIDPRIGSDSNPKVIIEVDGRVKFSEVLSSKEVVPINIDVTKASTIRIIVASQNFLDLHDHVTIANPKVTQ